MKKLEYSTAPYKHEMSTPKSQILNGSEIEVEFEVCYGSL